MTTDMKSTFTLPENFDKNSLHADNSKILHDQVGHRHHAPSHDVYECKLNQCQQC